MNVAIVKAHSRENVSARYGRNRQPMKAPNSSTAVMKPMLNSRDEWPGAVSGYCLRNWGIVKITEITPWSREFLVSSIAEFLLVRQEHAHLSSQAITRNITEKIEATNADLIIFWAPAHESTGCFKSIALVADLSDFDLQTCESSLKNLQYASFGCGNRNYQHYNKIIDEFVTGITSRGARAMMSSKGDEPTHATKEDFLGWKEGFFSVIFSQFNIPEYGVEYEPGVEIIEESPGTTDRSLEEHFPFVRGVLKPGMSKIVAVPIVTQHTIATYKESEWTCIHLELDFTGHRQIKYKTGDYISIWPTNLEEEISSLLQILELEARKDARIHPAASTTPHALFQHYLEICAPVARESVFFLADFAPTEKAKVELKALARIKETYAQFREQNHITLSRLLKHVTYIDPSMNWAGLPLSFVIDILPAMKPRTYSISSSPVTSPRGVSITVSTNPTRLAAKPGVTIPGLTKHVSTAPWTIYAQVCTSKFGLPFSISLPIVMVAAGTGFAPFRAFLQERAHLASVGRGVGAMLLFFGCQGESDFLYRDLITELQSRPLVGKLQVVTAFSRAEAENRQYVGDQLAVHSAEVSHLLTKDDGAFYICVATTIAKSAKHILREQLKSLEEWSIDQANA
ncbi:hypothetical protein F4803DRAFT_575187 [Xylaria telfairii]|nr:hypothetical protein F4803DRAFT_575187 [Xylaria telfairii]